MAHEQVNSIVASVRTSFSAFQRLYSTAIYVFCVCKHCLWLGLNNTIQKHNMSHNWFVKIPAGAL